jgi:Ca2+-transporting ATPase
MSDFSASQSPDGEPFRWHALTADQAVTALRSHPDRGLSPDEALARLARVGPNELPRTRARSQFAVFLGQFASPLIYLLLVAAGIALALGHTSDAVVILVVVLLNAAIGTVQEGRALRSLEALRQLTTHTARVVRDGREWRVASRDVVPGDILLLEAGDVVTADARLLAGAALRLAEAALTGESVPVDKQVQPVAPETALADRRNMVYAGTHVTAGRSRAVVVATAGGTELGHIAALAVSAAQARTPLEQRIAQFGRYIILAAIASFIAVNSIGLLYGLAFSDIVMLGISQVVGLIPEGLPVAMSIALAVGVQRMARRGAIVRRLSAVETLGSTTVICSDKTGTLTRNEMTVTTLIVPGLPALTVTGSGYSPRGQLFAGDREVDLAQLPAVLTLLEACVLCNDAQLHSPDHPDAPWTILGDPTEAALLTVATKAGLDPAELRARSPRRAELPFDPEAKMMATQHDAAAGSRVIIKGAPEVVLALCSRVRRGPRDEALDEAARGAAVDAAESMARDALRVLAIAVVDGAEIHGDVGFAGLRGRATLLGMLGEIDPPRPEVRTAIARCREAGVKTVMVTGDHKTTALAIARDLGIAAPGDEAVDGLELERLSATELDGRLDHISVFARVHPAQKLRIVEAYQLRREVVAVTGDGVNDAPALANADVGVAMGRSGTEVAKDAAKIVISDDNFATIVAAVEEGRVVYRNIKKSVLLLFSTSAAEVLVLLLAMLLGYPPPFAAVQILWNNLVTEGLITVNLVMEPAEGDEMKIRPVPIGEPLLSRMLVRRMALMVVTITLITLSWYLARTAAGLPPSQVQTETFTLLAICEWFNVLNCRSETRSALTWDVFKNRWLVGGLIAGNLLQLAVVFWSPLGTIFHTVPFGITEFVSLGVVGSLVLWVEELRKLLVRRQRH